MSSVVFQRGPLGGAIRVAGDKSISHRALMLGSVAIGETQIVGLNRGQDVATTRMAMTALGARISERDGAVNIVGGPLRRPGKPIDARNSGTTARLLIGLCAGTGIVATFDGDESLRRRPMERVAQPLRMMGAHVETTDGHLPVHVEGVNATAGGTFALSIASAQIKSALLLANLAARRSVRISGDAGSRDHTERMLRALGRRIQFNAKRLELLPGELHAKPITVPADLSAAAFFIVAAAVTPGSDLILRDVGVNRTRTGVLEVLKAMGAAVTIAKEHEQSGEPVAEIHVQQRPLRATTIAGDLVVRSIDEIPVLAVAAAFAEGTTRIRDAGELRLKESDRLTAMAQLLRYCGIVVQEYQDGLDITGGGAQPAFLPIETHGDHRVAMAAATIAAACGPVDVDDAECIAVSYPEFEADWATAQAPL